MATQDDAEKQRRPVNISAVFFAKCTVVTVHLAPFQVQTNWTPSCWLARTSPTPVATQLLTATQDTPGSMPSSSAFGTGGAAIGVSAEPFQVSM